MNTVEQNRLYIQPNKSGILQCQRNTMYALSVDALHGPGSSTHPRVLFLALAKSFLYKYLETLFPTKSYYLCITGKCSLSYTMYMHPY